MGNFSCKIGDSVMLKAEASNAAWVGLICGFQEEEEDEGKCANFMWFSSEQEIRNKEKKRTDFMPVICVPLPRAVLMTYTNVERALYLAIMGYQPFSID